MITRLGVRNFKRFLDLSLEMRPVTVLTGLNGSGKSALIQSLLLARQAACTPEAQVVALNGFLGLALGEVEDIQHPEADETAAVSVRVEIDGGPQLEFGFTAPGGRSLNLSIAEPRPSGPPILCGRGAEFTRLSRPGIVRTPRLPHGDHAGR